MTPRRYVSVLHSMNSLVWPEASVADLVALLGAENVSALTPRYVQVRNSSNEWVTLCDGWATGIDSNGDRHVLSAGALASYYRPEDL